MIDRGSRDVDTAAELAAHDALPEPDGPRPCDLKAAAAVRWAPEAHAQLVADAMAHARGEPFS